MDCHASNGHDCCGNDAMHNFKLARSDLLFPSGTISATIGREHAYERLDRD